MKLDDFYLLEFSDYCLHLYCYFHNVLADMSSDMEKAGGHIGRKVVENNNKDEDNSPKTLCDKNVSTTLLTDKCNEIYFY